MSSSAARTASRTASSTESRSTPGIEATGTRVFLPSTTNSGQIRSSVVSTFSRTMRRAHSDLRLRRMRHRKIERRRAWRGCLGLDGPEPDSAFDRAAVFDRHGRFPALRHRRSTRFARRRLTPGEDPVTRPLLPRRTPCDLTTLCSTACNSSDGEPVHEASASPTGPAGPHFVSNAARPRSSTFSICSLIWSASRR